MLYRIKKGILHLPGDRRLYSMTEFMMYTVSVTPTEAMARSMARFLRRDKEL